MDKGKVCEGYKDKTRCEECAFTYYLAKCPHDLQKENMNYWWDKEKNEELFFRFDGDEVRAMFTPKYKPVDNFEVL